MDEVTQQNSALVEENAATAKTLEQQSLAMTAEVSVFKIGDEDNEPIVSPVLKRSASASQKSALPAKAVKESEAPAKPSKPAAIQSRRATVGQMQSALAAVYDDPEWKDF